MPTHASSHGHGRSYAAPAAEPLLPSCRSSEKLSLPSLQSKMKCDPEGYESELLLLRNQFNSSLDLFHQQAALNFASVTGVGGDPTVAKDLGDRAIFLAHVTPFYPNHLADFPQKLADLMRCAARTLPSVLRCYVTRALILLANRKIVDIGETLSLFMDLQTLGDRKLRKLAFDHVVHSVRRMNRKHKNQAKNLALQNALFAMLQQEDEARARRALMTLCKLYKRKVWFDERTANAICSACLHPASRIMKVALSFLLDYEKIENDEDSSDSDSDDEMIESPQVVLSRETIYKASHQGTAASKKKKKAKLERAIRSMKRKQCLSSERNNNSYYSPLNHLKDAQGFAEKLFSRLRKCNEKSEVKMMLKLVAQTVGLHQLILLEFYPFLQKRIQASFNHLHQHDITDLLAAVVQACHNVVPPNAVEPLFKQIVNQFVHDRARPEVITVGINVVRDICKQMPLLMNEDLLQDLALYKKSHEKAVSAAARSLIALFKEVCPKLLAKKDRGRPIDPEARPKAYGEVNVEIDVPGTEFLHTIDNDDKQESGDSDDSVGSGSDHDQENYMMSISDDDDDENQLSSSDNTRSDDEEVNENDVGLEDEVEISSDCETGVSDADDDVEDKGSDEDSEWSDEEDSEVSEQEEDYLNTYSDDENVGTKGRTDSAKKRKFTDFNDQLINGGTSLRVLKKLAGTTMGHATLLESIDGILSNEDFQTIKELKAKQEGKSTLAQHGLAKSAAIKKKLSKEERLALVRAGREDRGKYQARTAVKQKKTGGLSNRQKERKKKMPLAAKRAKVARSQAEKKKRHHGSGKEFRGRKAWKC